MSPASVKRVILVLFDSLSKAFLPPYGNDWVAAPNFTRLASRSVTFDRCYVGSMPCMPARRELHTGRHNFLHRGWGPLEPFDDSMPEILKTNGVYSHLASDHGHYWEDGGCTYHPRYSSWEIARGQEGDPWKGQVRDPEVPPHLGNSMRQDWVNRTHWREESDWSQTQVFDSALGFIETNAAAPNWFLQVECFDPHPPFYAAPPYRACYPSDYDGPQYDFPRYAPLSEEDTPEAVAECRRSYAALVSQCDHSLGRILDAMDRHSLWEDTLLIVTTDHGFMLGEHDWWCFVRQPFYQTAACKPLFIWDPRCGRAGKRSPCLVQTHDLPATVLGAFGLPRPRDMQGCDLAATVARDVPVREKALFGAFGGMVSVTDGRFVYMRAPERPDGGPLYHYTLMPTHMRRFFSLEELRGAEQVAPLSFSKGCPVLRIPAKPTFGSQQEFGTRLYDLEADPEQAHPLQDEALEARMVELLTAAMAAAEAPPEAYARLGLAAPHLTSVQTP